MMLLINGKNLDSSTLEYWLEYDKREIADIKREYYDNMKAEQQILKKKIEDIEKRMELRKNV